MTNVVIACAPLLKLYECFGRSCAKLPTAAIHVLPRRLAHFRKNAAVVQCPSDVRGAFRGGPSEIEAFHRVERNQVEHAVLAAKKLRDRLDVVVAVVDPFEQRPLILNRVSRRACIRVAALDELLGAYTGSAWQQLPTEPGFGGVWREGERRFDGALWHELEYTRVADRG